MKLFRTVVLATQFLLFGCAQSLGFTLPKDEVLHLSVYEQGKPVQECVLPSTGPAHSALAAWLESNQSGWQLSPVGYAPHILVQGSTFSFNLLGSSAIVVYSGRQFVKPVTVSEFAFLRCTAGA
jgi:hypothetical protein